MGEKKDKERQERKEKEAAARQDKEETSEQKNTEKSVKKKTSVAITKTKTKEITTKIKKTEVTNDTVTSSRKIMPSKPLMTKSSTPPSSKLKKDENNKKVMETRKAAFAAKTQRGKSESEEKTKPKKLVGTKSKIISGSKASGKPSSLLADEERKVDEKSVAEKVSEAIASGEIDDSRVVKDDDDDKESIVVKDSKKEADQKTIPGNLVLEKEKMSYSHVKTPDEVDDLPEHEVVVPDSHVMEEIKSEMSGDL